MRFGTWILMIVAALPVGAAEVPASWQAMVATMGGEKPDFSSIEARGTFYTVFGEQEMAVSQTLSYRLPDRIRTEIGPGQLLVVVNGDRGVTRMGDRKLPMASAAAKAQVDELNRSFFSLIHYHDDDALKVAVGDPGDDPCEWLAVERAGAASNLCIDGDGRILRQRHQGRHPIQMIPGELNYLYGDYREVDGRWIPHRWDVTFEGNPVGRVELDAISFAPEFDDTTFRVDD